MGSAIGSVVGSVASGIFSSKEAQDNRDFQEEMSNTSYQRAVADMRAAGINPILAAKLGGASTPAGAMAKIPDFGLAFAQGASADAQHRTAGATEEKVEAEVEKMEKEGILLEEQVEQAKQQVKESIARVQQILAQEGLQNALAEIPKLIQDAIHAIFGKQNERTFFQNARQEINQAGQRMHEMEQRFYEYMEKLLHKTLNYRNEDIQWPQWENQ